MKKMQLKFSSAMMAVAIVLTSLSSCKKSDEGPSNYFSVDGSVKGIKTLMFSYDDSPGESKTGKASYNNEVDFISDGFTITGSEVTAGKGNALVIEFFGASASLDEGTYTFTGSEDDNEPFNIWEASYALNFDVSKLSSDEIGDITSGTMVVTKSGTTYTIKVNAKAGSKTIIGQYSGTIKTVVKD